MRSHLFLFFGLTAIVILLHTSWLPMLKYVLIILFYDVVKQTNETWNKFQINVMDPIKLKRLQI